MAVFGVDLGNLYSSVSVVRRRGIDVIMNEVSKRETNTVVGFGNPKDGRLIGEKGADMKMRNFRNTVTNLKRLVGIKFDSDEWREESKHCMFRAVEGEDGFIEVEVDNEEELKRFKPEQLVAMMLSKLGSYVDREAALDSGKATTARVVDCVISCPPYFSAFQRKRLQQAAKIAGLNCLTLVTEGTAIATAYGVFRGQELPEAEKDGHIIQFCDMGHACTYITTVKLWKGNMKVLSHVYDRNLGCRDFDFALADYFRGEIEKKYKMDVYEQKKAKLRLLAGCEKLRYTLSANPKVSLNVECIMNDVDISFQNYERDHFEELTAPLWERMAKLVARAAEGVDAAKLHSVEIVGGGTYMPKVKKMLSDAFGRQVSTTLNVSEAVAKGCGIIGAKLSPRFSAINFVIKDSLPNEIMIGYFSKTSTTPSPVDFTDAINQEKVLFEKNCEFPKMFDLSFDRKEPFDLYCYYKEPCDVKGANGSCLLGHWAFEDLPVYKDVKGNEDPEQNVRVVPRFELDASGLVGVRGATVTEKYEVETKVEKKKDEKEKKDKKDGDDEVEYDIVIKEKSRKIDVKMTDKAQHGLTPEVEEALRLAEVKMAAEDRLLTETADAKNAVEGYSYEFRSKAEEGGALFDYMTEEVRVAFRKACDEAADWVYGDGEDTTKEEYVKKLNELRRPGDAAMTRKRLREELPFEFESAEKDIIKVMDEANRLLGAETHICKDKLGEIVTKGQEAHEYLKKERVTLAETALAADILCNSVLLKSKVVDLQTFSRPIFNTPKPVPKPEEKKEEAPASPKEGEKKEEAPASPKEGEKKPEAGMDVDE